VLRAIDPAYDPKSRSLKDLAKMPIFKALFEDEAHCFDSRYALDFFDCGDPSCRFGCSNWLAELKADCASRGCKPADVEAAVQHVEARSVLPMATKKGDKFVPYTEAKMLPTTDERDLPSQAAAQEGAKKTEVRRRQEAADKAKTEQVGERIFHVSKVRSWIQCDDCKIPRVLYALKKPSRPLLAQMDAYACTISYMCGDPLFEEQLEDEALAELKATFFVKEAQSCRDPVERDFFNTGGVAGRVDFEYICSICGADPDDSPLVADAVLGTRNGLKLLPICEDCHADAKKLKSLRTYGKADQPKAKAAKRTRKAEAAAASSKRQAGSSSRGRGRSGRGRGRRGRGRGRGSDLPVDSSEDEAPLSPLPPRPEGKKRKKSEKDEKDSSDESSFKDSSEEENQADDDGVSEDDDSYEGAAPATPIAHASPAAPASPIAPAAPATPAQQPASQESDLWSPDASQVTDLWSLDGSQVES